MRHFLLPALPVGHLACGVIPGSAECRLVPATSPSQRLLAPDLGTPLVAVDVPAITPPADPHLPVTPRAVVKPITLLDHRNPRPPKGWTTGRNRGILRSGSIALDHRDDPEGPGTDIPWTFTFWRSEFLTTFLRAGLLGKNMPLRRELSRGCRSPHNDGEQPWWANTVFARFRRDSGTIDRA
jgi:hypothetical protein